ncbi:hypothetical protein [Candidatus Ichthyocystis sparus]|nr:hypothetical protein [Candidatus Ichthyocystis sparus]
MAVGWRRCLCSDCASAVVEVRVSYSNYSLVITIIKTDDNNNK